jgi:hypothetical protein
MTLHHLSQFPGIAKDYRERRLITVSRCTANGFAARCKLLFLTDVEIRQTIIARPLPRYPISPVKTNISISILISKNKDGAKAVFRF